MNKVIDMPDSKAWKMRRFEKLIEKSLSHSNQNVLNLWQEMVKTMIKKYPGVPVPSSLNVLLPKQASQKDMDETSRHIQEYIQNYIDQVKTTMLDMLSDIIVLQKEVAEKRVEDISS